VSKRLIDTVLACLAVIILSPLLALVGLAIVVDDGRPVIFRARRAGRGGQEISVYKFRTMSNGADGGSKISAADDPRVTRVGSVLRRTKIDELPQLVNVIQGSLSIVGPRPEDSSIVALHYTPAHMETLDVRPGLTSPGSIYYYTHIEQELTGTEYYGKYLEQVLPHKLALERYYVHNRSMGYDIKIIGRTIKAIFMLNVLKRQPPSPPEIIDAVPRYQVPMRGHDDPLSE